MGEEGGTRRDYDFKRSRYDGDFDRRDDRRYDEKRYRGSEAVLDEDVLTCPTFEGWKNKSSANTDPNAYCEYVKEWIATRDETFAKRHWREDWFLEKYDPERAEVRAKEHEQVVRTRASEVSAEKLVSLVQSSADAIVYGLEPDLNDGCSVYLPHIGPFVPRQALEKALQAEGATAIYLSDVNRGKKRKDLGRRGTITLKDAQTAKDCLARGFVTCWVTMDDDGVYWESSSVKDERRSEVSVSVLNHKALPNRILPIEANAKDRKERDERQTLQCAEILDETFKIERSVGIRAFLEKKPATVSVLDATLQYLRYVHFYCYYSGSLCKEYGELLHKSATPFIRNSPSVGDKVDERPANSNNFFSRDMETDPRKFFEIVDSCAEKIISSFEQNYITEQSRIADYSKKRDDLANVALEEFVQQNIVKKNTNFHCQLHDKLFQSEMYFRKHLINFHGSAVRSAQRKVLLAIFMDLFRLDTDKPLPRLPRFAEDVLRGEFTPPPERSFDFQNSHGDDGGRYRRDSDSRFERSSEPAVRRYRDPDAPKAEVTEQKPQKLQYRTRVSYAGAL